MPDNGGTLIIEVTNVEADDVYGARHAEAVVGRFVPHAFATPRK